MDTAQLIYMLKSVVFSFASLLAIWMGVKLEEFICCAYTLLMVLKFCQTTSLLNFEEQSVY